MEIEKENPTISPTDDDKFFSNNGGGDDDADSISLSSSSDQEDDDDIDVEQGNESGRQSTKKKLSRQGSLNQSILAPLPFGSMFADLGSPFENDNDDDIEGGVSDLDTSQKSVSTRGSRRSSLPKFLEKYAASPGEDIDGSQHSLGSSTRSGRRHSMKRIGSSSSLRNLQRRMSSFSPKIKKRKEKFHYRSRQKAQLDEVDAYESVGKGKKVRLNAWMNYEVFMWTWFIVLTVLAVVDRFGWNVWPRQRYTIGAGSAGSDRLVGFKPGPWSVVLYDCLARISGRYSIICYNFILITKLECLEILLTTPFVRKYILDTSNIINANTRLHNWNGIGLCVMTLLHIWSILFPCITHGYTAVVVPGVWEWPASERTPTKCKFDGTDEPGCWPGDANVELKQMGLQADDVFRLVEMTIFLVILMPISVRWFASRWHAATKLHRLINLVYFVDIVRRHSHPHSWILNTPVFVIYLIDAYIFRRFYHRNKTPEIKKVKLGDQFMILYWKSPHGCTDSIGPDYSLLLKNSSFLEEAHIFTCFENRSGIALGDEEDDFDWTVGVVIRIFRRKRAPRLKGSEVKSHTQRMYEETDLKMLVTGPRQGEMSEIVRVELLSPSNKPLILFGAGSAVNFIIDALQWSCVNTPVRKKVSIIYTTRDYHLFDWAMASITKLLEPCEERGIFFDCKMAYTGKGVDNMEDGMDLEATNLESTLDSSFNSRVSQVSKKSIKAQAERFDLYSEISPGAKIFCQGSAGVKNAAYDVCKKVGATFYGGRGGAREDLV